MDLMISAVTDSGREVTSLVASRTGIAGSGNGIWIWERSLLVGMGSESKTSYSLGVEK